MFYPVASLSYSHASQCDAFINYLCLSSTQMCKTTVKFYFIKFKQHFEQLFYEVPVLGVL